MKYKKYFAIFGNPVAHSKSPLMHNMAFAGLGIDACYGRYVIEDGTKLRDTFFALGLHGANVTVPHKTFAYDACDHVDNFAHKVGAVNTLVRQDGLLYGYNTDAPGFLKAIEEFDARSVLLLGAGGTAQSTAVILRDAGYRVTILNRSAGRLAWFEAAGFACSTYAAFAPRPYDLIVNMTSAGLHDAHLPAPRPLLDTLMPQCGACVDVIYGRDTPFLQLAARHTKPAKDGSDMLLYQGAIALEHFMRRQHTFAEILPYMQQALVL